MDHQHENHPGHRPTLQQLLYALNEELSTQTGSGQLASNPDVVRSTSNCSALTPALTLCFQLYSIEQQTKHALSKIHSSRNTLLTINRLPPEVLALIPYFLDSHKDLVNATLVCRHWRNTFIASPPLWSCLDSDKMHENLFAAYIDRCGAAPLDVTFSSNMSSSNVPLLEKLVACSTHIHKMRFSDLPWRHIAELSNAFDAPLPMLREADINASRDDAELPPFERPFLAGATNLVSLNLYDANWQSGTLLHFLIPTLTHLKLRFKDFFAPSVHELLEFFRNSPLIEDIRIDAIEILDTADENSAFPDQFQAVDLPYLRNVHLNWNTSRSQHTLLAHINSPPTCSVSTNAQSMSDTAQPPQNVFPKSWEAFSLPHFSSVTLRMKREQSSTKCTVAVTEPGGGSFSISHLQNLDIFVFQDDEGLVRQPNRDRDDEHVFSAAISLVRKLPLRRIREFVLEDLKADEMSKPESFEIPPDLAKLIRSDLPNLTALSLTRTCVSELFNVLALPPPPSHLYIADLFEEGGVSVSSQPCPTLKVLEMRHPEWIKPRNCPEVLELVKARKQWGIPFERVFFHSSVVPKGMIKALSPYVNDVDIQACHC